MIANTPLASAEVEVLCNELREVKYEMYEEDWGRDVIDDVIVMLRQLDASAREKDEQIAELERMTEALIELTEQTSDPTTPVTAGVQTE